ncbi:MAG: InlB B-repeat-containing protein, partial [Oscillospiraceae bacterium]|nr:InlB B-repeat-containing protein [Oscillospiraceae bacterium]
EYAQIAPFSSVSRWQCGDVDGDGRITINDALQIDRYLQRLSSTIADNNSSLRAALVCQTTGSPSAVHRDRILNHIVGISTPLRTCSCSPNAGSGSTWVVRFSISSSVQASSRPLSRVVTRGARLDSQGSIDTPTRSNHEFRNWYTDNSWNTRVTSSTSVTGNLNLVARWGQRREIRFSRGGGTGTSPATISNFLSAGSVTMPPQNNIWRARYVFSGWEAPSGNIFQPGRSVNIAMGTSALTFTAVWESGITITFNGNGHTSGSVPARRAHTLPASITIPDQGTLRRTGHEFVGWRSSSSGNILQPGQTGTWNNTREATLTAVWVPSNLYPPVTRNVRIRFDSHTTRSAANLRNDFSIATSEFMTRFGIDFRLVDTPRRDTFLDIATNG